MTPPETTPNQPKETPVTVTRWTLKDTLAVVGVTLAEHAKHTAGRALDRVGINIDLWLENLQIGYLPSPLCILCDRFAEDGDLCDRCKGILRDGLGITSETAPVYEPQNTVHASITPQRETRYSPVCGCYIPPGADRPVHRLACHLTTGDPCSCGHGRAHHDRGWDKLNCAWCGCLEFVDAPPPSPPATLADLKRQQDSIQATIANQAMTQAMQNNPNPIHGME